MNEQQIRALIQQEIAKASGAGRFNVQNIPRHTHNGTDSLPIYSPTITYAGWIPYQGGQEVGFILPTGWDAFLLGDNSYRVDHNLGTFFYTVTATPAQSTNNPCIPIVLSLSDSFLIGWLNVNDPFGGFVQTSFNFQLVQVNNKTSPLITYKTQPPKQFP